jgi:DNA repair protein RadA/Sms
MPRISSSYVCQQCGYTSPSYLGKCPECGTWNSLVETIEQNSSKSSGVKKVSRMAEIVSTNRIEKKDFDRVSTKISEFDRVLGGGIVPGSVVLVSGDPGIGKSTLLTQLAMNVSAKNGGTLYVAGEESAQQIKLRVERIDKNASLAVLNETDVDVITSVVENVKPPLVIVDSIQTMETADLESIAGSVGQVRESAHRLQRIAKALHVPIFIVGHVTKEGTIAGPRTLEHLVDVVLSLEGDPSSQFRILRANKNRFGPTDEVGIFDMEEEGMVEVANPSKIFLEQKVDAPGSAVLVTLTGLRPLLLEVQALVTKTNLAIPRRIGTGIDNNRLQLLVAVLTKRLKLPLYDQDIFVNVTGGVKIFEPASDLAICMAIISSFKDITLPKKAVFMGEVGLLGELRNIRQLERRVSEATKMGYTEIISSAKFKNLNQITQKLFQ